MKDKEFFITIKNDLHNNTNITNEELVVLAIIKKNYNQIKEISLTSINLIMNTMCVFNRNPKILKAIKNAIIGLIQKGYIKEIMNIKYDSIKFDTIKNNDLFYVELEKDFDNYFCVNEYDIDKIFDYLHNTNIDKFSFIRYYISICRVISSSNRFGWLTQKYVNFIGESKTISKYNKILADELNLIIYNNNYITQDRHYCSTYFGRYGDDINFNKQLQIEVGDKGLIYTNKIESNIKRSKTQKNNKSKVFLKV